VGDRGRRQEKGPIELHPTLAAADSLWGRSPRTNRNAGTGVSAGLRAPPGSQGVVCAGGVLVTLCVRYEANEVSCTLLLWQSTARVDGRPRLATSSLIAPKSWPINSTIPRLVGSKVPPFYRVTFPDKRGTMIAGALPRNTFAWERFQCDDVKPDTHHDAQRDRIKVRGDSSRPPEIASRALCSESH
jgi:hypothetical protein